MTLSEHIERMKQKVQELDNLDGVLFLASQTALAEFVDRVFVEGKSVSGGRFKYNDDKYSGSLYVNPATTFGNTGKLKPPRGKFGKTKFASTGKNHKTTWVENYKSLRGLVGREDGFVNLVAFGDLKSEIENKGARNTTIRGVSNNEYTVLASDENAGKAKGAMKKYPGMLKFSDKEKKAFNEAFEFQLLKLIRE